MALFEIKEEDEDEAGKTKVFRLNDIETKKVDFVDAAANRKRFFLFKKDNTEMSEEVKTLDLNGVSEEDIVIEKNDPEEIAVEAPPVEAEPVVVEEPVVEAVVETEKAGGKNKFAKTIDAAQAKLAALAAKIAELGDDADFGGAVSELKTIAASLVGKSDEVAEEAIEEVVVEEVEKAGRKISSSRMNALSEIQAGLEDLGKKFGAFISSATDVEVVEEEPVVEKAEPVDKSKEEAAALRVKLEDMKKRNLELAKQVKLAKAATQDSNGANIDRVESEPTSVHWDPIDLNLELSNETVERRRQW